MRGALRLGLRSGERIYINGAVLRVDRRVRLELLNDATFLLEAHVMKPEEVTSPMRRLYFLIQSVLMDPRLKETLCPAIATSIDLLLKDTGDDITARSLGEVQRALGDGSYFNALKNLRTLMKEGECEPA